ncbi:TPA: hypothetical protein L5E97_005751, partial [Pseudomonas aeruginosa]|nr:hypothetical protein [Pseudomonas aeruginosa]
DGAIAAQGANAAGMAVSSAVSTATSTIVAWLQKIDSSIQQGFSTLTREVTKQTAQQKVMMEGAIAAQTQLYMEKVRADATTKYELSPRSCYEAATGAAAGQAGTSVKQTAGSLNKASADRTLYTPSSAAVISRHYDEHVAKYCTAEEAAQGRCSLPSDPAMQGADIRVDTLLGNSNLTPSLLEAVKALIAKLVNAIPTQNIPKAWEGTAQGKAFIAGQYIEQARSSVAANSLNQAVALRTPVAGLGAAAMVNKADISPMELMETLVNGRFQSPDWYTMISGFSTENLLREQNKMQAFKLWMDLQSFQQMERVEAMLATNLAMDVKSDSAAQLEVARSAAAKAGQ